jgi:anti-sigma regulatory factor (Ser/Thr protein kinase)
MLPSRRPGHVYSVGVSHTATGRPRAQTEAWVRSAFARLSSSPAVRRVGLALVDGGGRQLSFTASDRDVRHATDWCHVDAYDDVPLNNAIRTGTPIAGSLDQLAGRYAAFVARQDRATCALAAVPLVAAGQVMGGYVLFYDASQRFDAAQLTDLQRLGEELGEHLRQDRRLPTHLHRSMADEPVADGARVAVHVVDAEHRAVGRARRFVDDQLAEWHVAEDARDTAMLCVSELVTNAIIHAVAGCEVRLLLAHDTLTVSVRDGGTGAPDFSGSSTDPLASHGRGLRLVEMITARWGSECDEAGMTVWCQLDLS